MVQTQDALARMKLTEVDNIFRKKDNA